MISFRKSQMNQLKDYLYHSCIHDSLLKDAQYNIVRNCFELVLFYPSTRYCNRLSFQDVLEIRLIKCFDCSYCDSETINTLIVEDNGICFRDTEVSKNEKTSDYIIFTLEMLSGDTINIVSKEISVCELGVLQETQGDGPRPLKK